MSASLLLGALALTVTSTQTPTTSTQTVTSTASLPPLEFEGERFLNEGIYRAVLRLPPTAEVNAETANEIEDQLHGFLTRAGYRVALVDAKVDGDSIKVFIDEGQLDKIVFPGQGTFRLLELRVAFDLPGDVFHDGTVEQQLQLLETDYAYQGVRYELVPVAERPEHHLFRGTSTRYALHVLLDVPEWQTGFGMEFRISFPDGLVGDFRYRGADLVFDDDRWETKIGGSFRFQNLIQDEQERRFVSSANAQVHWYTPALFGIDLRPRFGLRTEFRNRERLDLGLPSTDLIVVDPEARLALGIPDRFLFTIGGGAEWRRVLHKVETMDLSPHVDPTKSIRFYGAAELELVFDPDAPRRDRHDFLRIGGRHYAAAEPGEGSTFSADLETQLVFEIGFDELWVRTESSGLFGRIAFPDDLRLSSFVNGVFGNKFFTDRVTSIEVQYRLALNDDYLKLSGIGDFAVYEEQLDGDAERLGLAWSVGLGFHALVVTSFQFNLSVSAGFTRDGHAGFNIGAQLLRAY